VLEAAADLTETLARPPLWHRLAACRSTPVDHFATTTAGIAAARKNCARCPVAAECLEHALAVPELYGVWAATTPKERKRIVREAAA
jgi:WhiB family redox-sensing transcriptional regulator